MEATKNPTNPMTESGAASKVTFLPNFSHTFQHFVLPFNRSYVEVPDAKAGDLTPRSGWVTKLNEAERKYLEERTRNQDLQEKIKELEFKMLNIESTAKLNVEQLSTHIITLNKEIELHRKNEETLDDQIRNKENYINGLKQTLKDNEEQYKNHLNKVKLEYEKLEAENNQLTQTNELLSKETARLQLETSELRNEFSKLLGISNAEKQVLQSQLNDSRNEVFKINEKYIDVSRELERSRAEYEHLNNRISELIRESREKDDEIKRLSSLHNMAESKIASLTAEMHQRVQEKAEAMVLKVKEEKSDVETKWRLEKNRVDELNEKIRNLNESNLKLKYENESLRVKLAEAEQQAANWKANEKEMLLRFENLRKKYDQHFATLENGAFSNELKLTKYTQEIQTLKLERDYQDKLLFQYQQFIKMHKLETEFNTLIRLDKEAFSKTTSLSQHEIKERAAREYLLEKERKATTSKLKEKENELDYESKQKIESFKKGLEQMEDDLDHEWKNLFKEISNFENKIFS